MEDVVLNLDSSLSLWSLFWQADFVVKSVILGLAGASFLSWSIIFTKMSQLKALAKEAKTAQDAFAHEPIGYWEHVRPCSWTMPFSYVVSLFTKEWRKPDKATWTERTSHLVGAYLETQRDYVSSYMGALASIGSVSPFIGLFGTVWGIMNSFKGLVGSSSSNVAAVAPGIAEALFATAIGLIVAIPAVVAYNRLTLAIQSYMTRLESFSHVVHATYLEK